VTADHQHVAARSRREPDPFSEAGQHGARVPPDHGRTHSRSAHSPSRRIPRAPGGEHPVEQRREAVLEDAGEHEVVPSEADEVRGEAAVGLGEQVGHHQVVGAGEHAHRTVVEPAGEVVGHRVARAARTACGRGRSPRPPCRGGRRRGPGCRCRTPRPGRSAGPGQADHGLEAARVVAWSPVPKAIAGSTTRAPAVRSRAGHTRPLDSGNGWNRVRQPSSSHPRLPAGSRSGRSGRPPARPRSRRGVRRRGTTPGPRRSGRVRLWLQPVVPRLPDGPGRAARWAHLGAQARGPAAGRLDEPGGVHGTVTTRQRQATIQPYCSPSGGTVPGSAAPAPCGGLRSAGRWPRACPVRGRRRRRRDPSRRRWGCRGPRPGPRPRRPAPRPRGCVRPEAGLEGRHVEPDLPGHEPEVLGGLVRLVLHEQVRVLPEPALFRAHSAAKEASQEFLWPSWATSALQRLEMG